MDFLEPKMNIQGIILTCHTATNVIIGSLKRYYPKETVSRVIFETLKLAATCFCLRKHQMKNCCGLLILILDGRSKIQANVQVQESDDKNKADFYIITLLLVVSQYICVSMYHWSTHMHIQILIQILNSYLYYCIHYIHVILSRIVLAEV